MITVVIIIISIASIVWGAIFKSAERGIDKREKLIYDNAKSIAQTREELASRLSSIESTQRLILHEIRRYNND